MDRRDGPSGRSGKAHRHLTHKCKLALVGLVAGVVVLFAAAPAFALNRPNPAFNADGTLTDAALSVLGDPSITVSTSTGTNVIERARIRARRIPPLTQAGLSVAMAVGAGELYTRAYKMEIPGQGFIYRLWSGENYSETPISSWGGLWSWGSICNTTCDRNGANYTEFGLSSSSEGWMLRFTATQQGSSIWYQGCGIPYTTGNCTVGQVGGNVGNLTNAQNLIAATGDLITANTGGSCNRLSGELCQILVRSEEDMVARIAVRPGTSTEYNALGSGDKKDLGTYNPPAWSGGDETAAAEEFGDGAEECNTASRTAAQCLAEEDLAKEIDPDWVPEEDDGQVLLPRPSVNETYAEYLDRLRQGGWVGTADITVLDDELIDDTVGPHGVSKIRLFLASGTTTIPTDGFPTPAPRFPPDTDIRLIVNPPTAPPLIPGPAGLPGGGSCDCPPIDLGPLEVGATEKFPFGGITWLHGFLSETLETEGGELPHWEFTKPVALGGGTFDVNIPENEYRSYTDPLLKLFVVVASLWFAFAYVTNLRRGDDD